jgi:hypothetical protein
MKVGDLVRDIEFGDTGILLSLPCLSEDCKGEDDTYYVANVFWCSAGMSWNTVTDYIEALNESR